MKRIGISDLQAFAVIARLRSFRRAATELGVSPSALSHTIRGLESRLDLRLLNRSTRSVAPTEAGERLLARLAPALLEIDTALGELDEFRGAPHGTLRINAPHAAVEHVLPHIVTRFLTENPGMRLEVVADNALVDIVAGGFDAGIRFGESLDQDMIALPIGPKQRFVVVASPAYLATHGTPQTPRELPSHRCIGIRFPSGHAYRWAFEKAGERLDIEIAGALVTSAQSLTLGAAEAGLGLAYVYECAARHAIAAGRLVTVLDDWRPAEPGFFLYYPSRKQVPGGLDAFVALVRALRAS